MANRRTKAEREASDRAILQLYYNEYMSDLEIAEALNISRQIVVQRRKSFGLVANTPHSGVLGKKMEEFIAKYAEEYRRELMSNVDEREKYANICLHCEFHECIDCISKFREHFKRESA